MKVAIYARYSSENQRDASIADQFRVCREFAQRQGWHIEREYSDHAISGATLMRPGFQAFMAAALRKEFDIVLAEALDRFRRDQEDTASLFKRLTFAGVNIVTLAEGDITHLHIGLKGTMNALFLKELAETRRGMRGRVELGKAGGGLCYAYRVVRQLQNGIHSAEVVRKGTASIQPVPATEVSLLRPDEMRRVRRRFHRVLARAPGMLRCAWSWHVYEPPDDSSAGSRRTRSCALKDKLMRKDFFEEFCREFAKEMNRLRMERRAGLNSAKRELVRLEARRKKIVESIMEGVRGRDVKDELIAIGNRRDDLEAQLKVANEPPPLLHPSMADVYRTKVEGLAAALQRDDTRLEASEILRGLIDAIVLIPEKGQLRIELRGNLAAMLTAAQKTRRSPETGDLLMPVQLVAGAGLRHGQRVSRMLPHDIAAA